MRNEPARIWAAKDVALQRGFSEQEWEALKSILPNTDTIYEVEDEPDT